MLTKEEMGYFENKLLQQQERLIQQLSTHFDLEISYMESTGELSSYDNHPADMGTEIYERGKDVALNEHAEMELDDINKALHAIEEGTYGICRVCSEDIALERLEVLPTADTCVKHTEDKGRFMEKGTVEEDTANLNFIPNSKEQVGYDAEDAWQDVARYGTSNAPSDFYEDKADYDDMYFHSEENRGIAEDIEAFPDQS